MPIPMRSEDGRPPRYATETAATRGNGFLMSEFPSRFRRNRNEGYATAAAATRGIGNISDHPE